MPQKKLKIKNLKNKKKLSSNTKILGKPRTSVCGESWVSKSPNKLRTLVRRNTQGLFDIINKFINFNNLY